MVTARLTLSSELFFASTFILLCTLPHGLFAAEQAIEPAREYNEEATKRLLGILAEDRLYKEDSLHSGKRNYYLVRSEIRDLIHYKNADPNVAPGLCNGSLSAFGFSIFYNDLEMMRLCLKRGQGFDFCGIRYTGAEAYSLHQAQSTQAAQMLIAAGATVPKNIVSCAIETRKPAALLAFFCNAGADINFCNDDDNDYIPKKSILERLDVEGWNGKENDLLKKTAILLWFNAEHKEISRVSRVDLRLWGHLKKYATFSKNYAEWINQLDLLKEVLPAAKNERLDKLLAPYIAKDPAGIVREYMGSHIGWDDSCFPDIERRMKQAEIAKKTAERKKLAEENTTECSICSIS